ncbi:MAG: sigma-54-dependent Fis family transcriptional regulator [Candidatus Jettenia sp.]|uniref:Two-component response regulator n=1 Tax=Candidatus Jettenia caeni TaxID=247490 RepID=I3IMK3_9BACT|nr:sigma-54 dependent transcriptional regulator [Candidatus Jettenia sp. AMX1]MBC6928791.1 sigma-54-dependent Fis family transcriptional regulator [Candidatus Jettenia sp.]NUN23359.1 sigma-54-dependent Fis family transcriptional regulator [Candidatus Jettenia caeni]KAA0250762.1 MAG: sigma-54-dependent Fis family transcriptional regulator [Candidatus Jettenia sp. AMX1]MCE7880103.1 sigma-54-dependent Fis family transcriptional regulator [Candidatus Jettenia sp. AMX1]MCQ3926884.1 sigma-54-depende
MIRKKKILVVEDDEYVLGSIRILLNKEGYEVNTALNGLEALNLYRRESYDLVIADLKMPQMDGIELLKQLKLEFSDVSLIMMTAYGSIRTAVEAMKMGAYDYVTKPVSAEEIRLVIQRAFERQNLITEIKTLRKELEERFSLDNIIGKSYAMQRVYDLILQVANTDATVLITGETGTGKELVAHAIHHNSKRKNCPFVVINCSALPESLLESELFGHEEGAFTGATKQRVGKFEFADTGTVFFDEMGNLPLSMQTKLLRLLQEKSFERIGGNQTIKVDVRVLAATNKDLNKLSEEGCFRKDLYYRLNVIPIQLPSLKERREDIPLLVTHFIEKYNKVFKKEIKSISQNALNIMMSYGWPGNVRELENLVERALIMAKDHIISEIELPVSNQKQTRERFEDIDNNQIIGMSLEDFLAHCENKYITRLLKQCKGRIDSSAKISGIDVKTLYRKMKKYNINKDFFKD